MSATLRRILSDKQEFQYRRGFTPSQMEAARKRMNFFNQWIVKRDPTSFSTKVERQWGYIAKRQYNYAVIISTTSYSAGVALLLWNAVMFTTKKVPLWPLAAFIPAAIYFRPLFNLKHNKRLFDMCNVGEQYQLGKARNQVLRECNELLGQEDF